jgi:hypothetical protein
MKKVKKIREKLNLIPRMIATKGAIHHNASVMAMKVHDLSPSSKIAIPCDLLMASCKLSFA